MDNGAQAHPQQMQRLIGSVARIDMRSALAAISSGRVRASNGLPRTQAVEVVQSLGQSGGYRTHRPVQGEAA